MLLHHRVLTTQKVRRKSRLDMSIRPNKWELIRAHFCLLGTLEPQWYILLHTKWVGIKSIATPTILGYTKKNLRWFELVLNSDFLSKIQEFFKNKCDKIKVYFWIKNIYLFQFKTAWIWMVLMMQTRTLDNPMYHCALWEIIKFIYLHVFIFSNHWNLADLFNVCLLQDGSL